MTMRRHTAGSVRPLAITGDTTMTYQLPDVPYMAIRTTGYMDGRNLIKCQDPGSCRLQMLVSVASGQRLARTVAENRVLQRLVTEMARSDRSLLVHFSPSSKMYR
jgi:hypothetical protein